MDEFGEAGIANSGRGRFMQPDAIGLKAANKRIPQTLNLYSHVNNDPVNFVDPGGACLIYWYQVSESYGYWDSVLCRDDRELPQPELPPDGGGGGDYVEEAHQQCKNYVPNDLSSNFTSGAAAMIASVAAENGVSPELIAVTWAGESGFVINPLPNPANIPGVGQTYDVGPMQMNDYYTADEIKRGLYDFGPYSYEDVFGTFWREGTPFNGNTYANLTAGARKLRYLVRKEGNERDAAGAYVGDGAGATGRMGQYDKWSTEFKAYFECFNAARRSPP